MKERYFYPQRLKKSQRRQRNHRDICLSKETHKKRGVSMHRDSRERSKRSKRWMSVKKGICLSKRGISMKRDPHTWDIDVRWDPHTRDMLVRSVGGAGVGTPYQEMGIYHKGCDVWKETYMWDQLAALEQHLEGATPWRSNTLYVQHLVCTRQQEQHLVGTPYQEMGIYHKGCDVWKETWCIKRDPQKRCISIKRDLPRDGYLSQGMETWWIACWLQSNRVWE